MKAVILAAGRGSRLKTLTDDKPKCLNTIGDKPLIEWQINAFRKCGIEDIIVVTGYMNNKLDQYGDIRVLNDQWQNSNMVQSLLCARKYITETALVSYSDILYGVDPVLKLMHSNDNINVIYDKKWKKLWSMRFENPADDAESFSIDHNDHITEIGKKLNDISKISGQYIGLLKINEVIFEWIDRLQSENKIEVMKADMTSLLQTLIENQYIVKGVPINGGWCEIDNPKDLSIASKLYDDGHLRLII